MTSRILDYVMSVGKGKLSRDGVEQPSFNKYGKCLVNAETGHVKIRGWRGASLICG
jgi:hypothetical protein